MVLVLLCFTAVVAVLPVTWGLQWTGDLPDGAVVHACKGGSMVLPWNVTLEAAETINDIKWFYEGRSHEMIAIFSSDNFFPMPAFSQRVQHVGHAGIVLSHVTPSDAGNYSVELVAHEVHDAAGKLSTFRHSAVVDVVNEPPVSSGVRLHVRQEPVAMYDQSTKEWRVVLNCGSLTNRGHPPVDVIWMTPSGLSLASTSYADGEFRLLLPNPVTGGTYTCHLPHDSPAAACLPKDSPMLTPAAVDVDEVKARLSLIEVEQRLLREENQRLEAENAALKDNFTSYVHGLEKSIVNIEENVRAIQGNLTENLKHQLAQTNERIDNITTRHVSFYARLSNNTHFPDGATIILSNVITNDGGAYSSFYGYFTAPYNGTYVFLATASAADSSHLAELFIAVEGSRVVSNLYADEDNHNMGSCQAVIHLRKGQRVWLRSLSNSSYLDSTTTTFNGFLLNTD